MGFIGSILLFGLDIFFYIIIISVVLSWLIAFEVINVRNDKARSIITMLDRLTDPIYRPLRKVIPPIGGIDLTPMIVIFGIYIMQQIVYRVFF